jgi:DNA-binding FadR family transcriptional regulator
MDSTLNLLDLKSGLSKRTIRSQVSERLAQMIQSGLLRPGDELPSERELATTLEVSRETIRGAIQTLAAIGMVESSQGSRTRVIGATDFPIGGRTSVPPPQEFRDVHEARKLVELPVVKLAVERISPSDLDRLSRLVEAQRDMIGDPVRFQISDAEFHDIIYRAGGNPKLSDFLRGLYSFGLEYRRQALRHGNAVSQSLADHQTILDAFGLRDADAAARAVEKHLSRIHDTTIAAMEPA